MGFLFRIDFSGVLLKHISLDHSELGSLFLSLVLELLVTSRVFKHLLRVVISLGFDLIVILFGKRSDLFIEVVVDLLL